MASRSTNVTQKDLKAHYLCTKAECLSELKDYKMAAHTDLTVQELRVLLREGRKAAGLIKTNNQDGSIMADIKKANRDELRRMCSARNIPFVPKTTVGELRLTLRQYVINSATGETEVTFGKHAGATFSELYHNKQEYVEWAVNEVQSSSDPDWRLVQLANWARKMKHNTDLWTEETVFGNQETHHSIVQNMNKGELKMKAAPAASALPNDMPLEEKKPENQEMMDMMRAMMMKIHTLSEEVQEVKSQYSGSSQKAKTRKTATSHSFEEVNMEPSPETSWVAHLRLSQRSTRNHHAHQLISQMRRVPSSNNV